MVQRSQRNTAARQLALIHSERATQAMHATWVDKTPIRSKSASVSASLLPAAHPPLTLQLQSLYRGRIVRGLRFGKPRCQKTTVALIDLWSSSSTVNRNECAVIAYRRTLSDIQDRQRRCKIKVNGERHLIAYCRPNEAKALS